MKFDTFKLDKENNLLSVMVFNGLAEVLTKTEDFEKFCDNAKGIYDIKLTVNNVEIDVEKFANDWQKQLDSNFSNLVKNHLKEKFGDIFIDIENKLRDFEKNLEFKIDDLEI